MNGVVERTERPADTAGEERLQAEKDGCVLRLCLRKGRVVSAAYEGVDDPAEQEVFDAFCAVIDGLPIQEAADHAGHHVMARLQDPAGPRPVPGITTPWNADPLYRRPLRLIRQIRDDWAAHQPEASTENFWNPTISKDWLTLDEAGQLARIDQVLDAFRAERGLASDDLVAVGVETNIRVLLAFSDAVSYALKPALLMDAERRLRAATGVRLEVFAEEMADGNRIRRL